jgi:hypothetical protein
MPPRKKAVNQPKAARKPKAASVKAEPKAKARPKTAAKPRTVKAPAAAKPAPANAAKPPIPSSPLKKMSKRGETQMLAFIRDPQCLFTYWEVTEESIATVKQQLKDEFHNSSMVLRVFRKDADGQVELIREIFVDGHEMNRYIEIDSPNGRYYLEIAHKAPSGQLFVHARSNEVWTGPNGFSVSAGDPGSGDAAGWETPAGLMEYFAQEEFTEVFPAPGGPSSMDSLKRKKGRYASSNIK